MSGQCYCYVYASSLQEFEKVLKQKQKVKLAQKSVSVAQERKKTMCKYYYNMCSFQSLIS